MTKKKLMAAMGIVVAVIGVTVLVRMKFDRQEPTAPVVYGNVEIRDAQLAFNEQELVAEVLAEEGDVVEQGQVLAKLRDSQLKTQLEEAKAQAEAQRQVVDRLENGTRPQEIRQARAEVEAAQVRVRNARLNLQRLESTSEVGASSRQALDDARAALAVEEAQHNVTQQALDLALAGPRAEDIAEARARLEANRSQVDLLAQRLADTVLHAPAPGIIQSRILEPGEMAGPTRPAFILALTDPKWVRAYVPERDLGRVAEGMSATVTSDSWPDRTFEGHIGFISPTAEFTPQPVETEDLRTKLVYEIRVLVADPDNRLRLGMPVTVRVAAASAASGMKDH